VAHTAEQLAALLAAPAAGGPVLHPLDHVRGGGDAGAPSAALYAAAGAPCFPALHAQLSAAAAAGTLRYALRPLPPPASCAAPGCAATRVGSAGEVLGSMDLIKEIDRLTINANTVRQAEAARTQAANYATQAAMSQLSAQNLSSTAGTIYPGLSVSTSLLGSAADIGTTWARNRRLEELLGGVSTKRI
jgi:hypothetical protein